MGNPFTRRDSNRLLRVLKDDKSAAALINVLEEFATYDMPEDEERILNELITSLRREYPNLSTRVSQSRLNLVIEILGRPQEGGQERLNRRLRREEADSMIEVIRHDRSAAAAINVLQDLLRYDIPGSARTSIPNVINTIRSNHSDLSTQLNATQTSIMEEIIGRVLLPFSRNGGKTRRRRRTRKNRK